MMDTMPPNVILEQLTLAKSQLIPGSQFLETDVVEACDLDSRSTLINGHHDLITASVALGEAIKVLVGGNAPTKTEEGELELDMTEFSRRQTALAAALIDYERFTQAAFCLDQVGPTKRRLITAGRANILGSLHVILGLAYQAQHTATMRFAAVHNDD